MSKEEMKRLFIEEFKATLEAVVSSRSHKERQMLAGAHTINFINWLNKIIKK